MLCTDYEDVRVNTVKSLCFYFEITTTSIGKL